MRTIDAEYENGVLRPSEKLPLSSGEHVDIIVLRRPDPRRWDADRIARSSHDEGILTEQGISGWLDALDAEDRG